MIRKVIYVSIMRLSDKAARDWYLDFLIANGISVEYWDVTSLVFGEDGHSSKKAEYLRTPRTYQEVEATLRRPENRDACYVVVVTYERRTAKLYRLLSKNHCRMLFIDWGALPTSRSTDWYRRLSDPAATAINLLWKSKAIIYRKLRLIKPFDIVFAAGEALMSGSHYALRVVPINLVDYDHYVEGKSDKGRLVKGRYVVFLDIYLPYQSDLKITGLATLDPCSYYLSLNRFFKLLELKYEIKVVIAAHPKSDYGIDTFQGRETFRGRTAELVRDADFVVSHHSTSNSYAVLNRKPIIFVYTEEMLRMYKYTRIREIMDFAKYLDAAIYNIDKITQCSQVVINAVNLSRYDGYKYSFLTTHESEHTTTQEIFWREINA